MNVQETVGIEQLCEIGLAYVYGRHDDTMHMYPLYRHIETAEEYVMQFSQAIPVEDTGQTYKGIVEYVAKEQK